MTGVAKRKRKKVEESIVKSQKGTLYKHFIRSDVPAYSSSSKSASNRPSDVKNNEVVRCFIIIIVHCYQCFFSAAALHSVTLSSRYCEDWCVNLITNRVNFIAVELDFKNLVFIVF